MVFLIAPSSGSGVKPAGWEQQLLGAQTAAPVLNLAASLATLEHHSAEAGVGLVMQK